MPLIKLTAGDDNPVLINTNHILVVRHRTDEDSSEYCEVEMLNTDAVAVNETIAEIEAIVKAAS
jgi:hypothetical protein